MSNWYYAVWFSVQVAIICACRSGLLFYLHKHVSLYVMIGFTVWPTCVDFSAWLCNELFQSLCDLISIGLLHFHTCFSDVNLIARSYRCRKGKTTNKLYFVSSRLIKSNFMWLFHNGQEQDHAQNVLHDFGVYLRGYNLCVLGLGKHFFYFYFTETLSEISQTLLDNL